jgi:hypothetical protein
LDSALPPLKLLLKIKTTRDLRKYSAVIKYGFDLYPPSSVPDWQMHNVIDYLHRREQSENHNVKEFRRKWVLQELP